MNVTGDRNHARGSRFLALPILTENNGTKKVTEQHAGRIGCAATRLEKVYVIGAAG